MWKLPITLTETEYKAVFAVAQSERRHVKDQAAIMLRDRLIDLGLIGPLISLTTPSVLPSSAKEVSREC